MGCTCGDVVKRRAILAFAGGDVDVSALMLTVATGNGTVPL
jgi:hypothetical protein